MFSATRETDVGALRIAAFPESETPGALRRQVVSLQEAAWPPDAMDGPQAHDPSLQPCTIVLLEGERVIAALDVLRKSLDHAGSCFTAAGLSAVVTKPSERRRGHASRLAAYARAWMPDQQIDLGIFTCDREICGVYTAAGWRVLEGAVLVGGTSEEPFPSDQPGWDKVVLVDFFSQRAVEARSTFENSRVALHPGRIDRLW